MKAQLSEQDARDLAYAFSKASFVNPSSPHRRMMRKILCDNDLAVARLVIEATKRPTVTP